MQPILSALYGTPDLPWSVEKMLHQHVVSASETHSVFAVKLTGNTWVTELIAIIYVRPPVVLYIAACAFNTIEVSLPRILPVLARWNIPAALTIGV